MLDKYVFNKYISGLLFFIFFKDFIYLFMREREREAEGEAGSTQGSPTWD